LENGMSLKLLFGQLQDIREKISMPLVLMGYLNPVLQYGMERFLADCRRTGIDGLILPDLPLREFNEVYKGLFEEAGISLIMLITPQTPAERIGQIVEATGGFVYMVADSSVTGATNGIGGKQMEYFERVRDMNLPVPRLIGFGISGVESFRKACEYAGGAIIGSAFIRILSEPGEEQLEERIRKFVYSVLEKPHY